MLNKCTLFCEWTSLRRWAGVNIVILYICETVAHVPACGLLTVQTRMFSFVVVLTYFWGDGVVI